MDPAPTSARWPPRSQRQKVADQLEAAVAAGAEVVTGGGAGGHESGHFFSPAVVVGADASTALLSEETFGPVAPLVPSARSTRRSRSPTRPGSASAPTSTPRTWRRCCAACASSKAGTVWFNDPLTDNDAGPFGGFKQSGLGRELGREGLEAFQETKHVHIETKIEEKEWWYPYGDERRGLLRFRHTFGTFPLTRRPSRLYS